MDFTELKAKIEMLRQSIRIGDQHLTAYWFKQIDPVLEKLEAEAKEFQSFCAKLKSRNDDLEVEIGTLKNPLPLPQDAPTGIKPTPPLEFPKGGPDAKQ